MHKKGCIGVVTVTYNSAGVLQDFLRCLTGQEYDNFLLYVVDNASTDSTLQVLSEHTDPRLTIIANPTNLGVAEGNNQGIRAALDNGCEAVLLLNNDTEFDQRLISMLLDGLERHESDMTCPKMLYFDNPKLIWAAGGAFERWRDHGSNHFGYNALDDGSFDRVQRVTYVPTCCVLIRSRLFATVGLMDSRYFVYADDLDFMYRAWRAGAKLIYLPDARVFHKVSRLTGGEESPFAIRYGTRNLVFFRFKHFGLIPTIPWLLSCQLRYISKLLTGWKSWSWFKLTERAFLEGLTLFQEARRPCYEAEPHEP